jgi:hypothetical protein
VALGELVDWCCPSLGRVPRRERRAPSNKMKLTNLSEAPGKLEAPPRAFRRFAAVRTGSQLIPGVVRTMQETRKQPGASARAKDVPGGVLRTWSPGPW